MLYAENPRELWRASLIVAHFAGSDDVSGAVTSAAEIAGLVTARSHEKKLNCNILLV